MFSFWRRWSHSRHNPTALAEHLREHLPTLCGALHKHAMATGKPRGLIWVAVVPQGEPEVVQAKQGWMGLVPVVIQFAPVPGSDMEEIPQASDPRPAVGLFTWDGQAWQTTGRVIFNLSIQQVRAQLSKS